MKKIVPKELTEEELLKALENQNEERSVIDHEDDILSFLSFYNITNGNEKVLKKLLFKIYREWSDNPLKNPSFSSRISLYLDNDDRGFFVNQSSINLSVSAYNYLSQGKRDKLKTPKYRKHFESFLSFYDLKKGKEWVPNYVLYYLYDKWTYKNKSKRALSEDNFGKFLTLHFERKRIRKKVDTQSYWYRVDPSIYNHITKDQVKEMIKTRKFHVKKRKKSRKKTTDQAQENQVPES